MNTNTLLASLSGLLAASLSFIELSNAKRKPLSVRATFYILLRLALDAGVALCARALLVSHIINAPAWFTGVWPALVAGLLGPAILRSQFRFLKQHNITTAYGIADIFGRVQKKFDGEIDDICSVAQATWINRRALPALRQIPLNEITQEACDYMRSLGNAKTKKPTAHIQYINSVANDPDTEKDDKYRCIITYLLENDGRRIIKSLVTKGKTLNTASS